DAKIESVGEDQIETMLEGKIEEMSGGIAAGDHRRDSNGGRPVENFESMEGLNEPGVQSLVRDQFEEDACFHDSSGMEFEGFE
ncbi:hypothetical protein Dimus_034339, partial [Dionaea muscipula]